MPNIAIAGGSQGLGSAIVAEIEALGRGTPFILSRAAREDDPRYLAVDYDDIANIQTVLEKNDIHTLISALGLENGGGQAQLNLIEGAELASPTKRFIPSEFGPVYTERHASALPSALFKLTAATRFSASKTLSYTLVLCRCGLICKAISLFSPVTDGKDPIVVTHTSDIARNVAALLVFPIWEKRYSLIGNRVSIGKIVSIAEEVKGVAFEKVYQDRETLARGGD
ncbi:hypothetical protein BJX70DRAFT_401623 [Aspergillus crustosus]